MNEDSEMSDFMSVTWRDWIMTAVPSIAFLGCQLAWSVQIGYTTPTLVEMGLPESLVNYVWLAGPFSGTIVQPIVGVWSDSCRSKYGQRRPFIFVGALCVVVALVLFSNARDIGVLLGDGHGGIHRIGLTVGIASFWLLDFSINVLQGPLRALLTDILPRNQHNGANAFFGVMNGVGKMIGYGLGGVSSLRILYTIGALVVATTSSVTLYWTRLSDNNARKNRNRSLLDLNVNNDVTADNDENASVGAVCSTIKSAFVGLFHMSSVLKRAFIVQFFTYFANFCTFIYLTDWVGTIVAGGNPHAPTGSSSLAKYQRGVKLGNVGLMCMAILSIVVALALPKLLFHWSTKFVWMMSLLLYSCVLLVMPWIHSEVLALVVIALIGIPLAVSMVVPWTIVTRSLKKRNSSSTKQRGLLTGTFNLSQSCPEFIVALVSGFVVVEFGSVSAVMFMGGIFALIGAVCCCFIIEE